MLFGLKYLTIYNRKNLYEVNRKIRIKIKEKLKEIVIKIKNKFI